MSPIDPETQLGRNGPSNVVLGSLCAAVLIDNCAANLYAALYGRGLYGDGAHYLLWIADHNRLYLFAHARRTVDVLRQALPVALSRLTDLTLWQLGQAFTFWMLVVPVILCALCWPILPDNRKAWIVFPILSLLAGSAASTFAAIGEGAISASYLWPLFFLFLFRTRHPGSRIIFLILCVPAFFLHEVAFLFMLVFLFACAWRYIRAQLGDDERIFLAVSAGTFVTIITYELYWIAVPQFIGDRADYFGSLIRLKFLLANARWNLPLALGVVAVAIFLIMPAIRLIAPMRVANVATQLATIIFACLALASATAAWTIDATFSPAAQLEARNQAIFVSTVLAVAAAVALYSRILERVWMQPTAMIVLVGLCVAQFSWDVAATTRWRDYVADFKARLANSNGLIGWDRALASGDPIRDREWRLMSTAWVMPTLSIILQSGAPVRSMISAEIEDPWPFDPSVPESLPKVRGVDYTPYVQTLALNS